MRRKTCLSSRRVVDLSTRLFSAVYCQLSIKRTCARITYHKPLPGSKFIMKPVPSYCRIFPSWTRDHVRFIHQPHLRSCGKSTLRSVFCYSLYIQNCNFDAARVSATKFVGKSSRLRGSFGPRDEVRSCEDGWFARPVRCAHCKAKQVARPLAWTLLKFNRWLFNPDDIHTSISLVEEKFPAPCALDSNEPGGKSYVSILSSGNCFNCLIAFITLIRPGSTRKQEVNCINICDFDSSF